MVVLSQSPVAQIPVEMRAAAQIYQDNQPFGPSLLNKEAMVCNLAFTGGFPGLTSRRMPGGKTGLAPIEDIRAI
jgi:hypothetical protein